MTMTRGKRIAALVAVVALGAGAVAAQDVRGRGVFNFLTPINPDPMLQHAKEAYVRNGCAYCHGVELSVQNGEAANLNNSVIVQLDHDGDQLIPLLRRGIPQTPKLSPMPQFADLSDQELRAIVRWVHYARQQRRLGDLSKGPLPVADAAAGKDYFAANCASCHSAGTAFAALRAKHDAAGLAKQVAHPDFVNERQTRALNENVKRGEAQAHHLWLLERYTPQIVSNLSAYIQSW
jgi:mono/diheme cytochrome c family protein